MQWRARGLLLVVHLVVGAHLDEVLAFLQIRSEVIAESHHAILMESHPFAVEEDFCGNVGTLELDEYVLSWLEMEGIERERLSVPDDALAHVVA